MNGLKQPIISAVTGHTEQLYTDKAIISGMNQVFSKPVQIPVLKDLMKKLEFYDPLTDVKNEDQSEINNSQILLIEHIEDLSIQDE